MKTCTKTILSLVTASVMATSVLAVDNESASGKVRSAKAGVQALAITLENMGAEVDTSVNLDGAYTAEKKVAIYDAKHSELQAQFDKLRSQITE